MATVTGNEETARRLVSLAVDAMGSFGEFNPRPLEEAFLELRDQLFTSDRTEILISVLWWTAQFALATGETPEDAWARWQHELLDNQRHEL